MHNAPSVSYLVGRSRFAAALMSCAWLVGVATAAVWVAQLDRPGFRAVAIAISLMMSGGFAAWSWHRTAKGELSWDGQAWSLRSGGTSGTGSAAVVLDLQLLILLRWEGADGRAWLWLEGDDRNGRWKDLRRAVYSRARPEAPPHPRQPASRP